MFDFLSNKFAKIFSSLKKGKITESDLNSIIIQVKDALLEADVPYALVETFIKELTSDLVGQKLVANMKPAEQLISLMHSRIINFLGGKNIDHFTFNLPAIVMVMGLQGSGKTTTIAKIAYKVVNENKKNNKNIKVLVASIDFNRPAAIDQLEQMAEKAKVSFFRAQSKDPVQAIEEILDCYKKEQCNLLLIDTAGRMHVDGQMLEELKKVDQVLEPDYKLLVLDAMTGQESLAVAQTFEQAIGFQAAVLTKMDSDTRGGAVFSFCYALKKPIAYLGEGEKIGDLSYFYTERIANRILDLGDMQSLLEQAQEKIKNDEQKKLENAFNSESFTLEDFASQMSMVNKLGSLTKLMKYMPGMKGLSIPSEKVEQGEREMKKFAVILSSMTRKERLFPAILNNTSRRNRIAKGAGVTLADLNSLLRQFEEAQQYVKLMKKMGYFKGMFR